jgi:1-deoxy-D-xylulose-5-phosphate reductoisomerase
MHLSKEQMTWVTVYCMIINGMNDAVKRIAVLGSTGSIGQQTLDVVRALFDRFQITGLAAGRNINLLAKQVKEFKPGFVHCEDEATLTELTDVRCEFLSMEEMASHPGVDTVVIATSGKAGLAPTLAAVKAEKGVALANKEALVMAGEIVTKEAKRHNDSIQPVDSEHSAIWQCLQGEKQPPVRIILTASGGPFFHHSVGELEEVTVSQALNHPSWQMGRKVTVDSATLMNKGLEVIEAHWLFDTAIKDIEVVIHPQSIIHSMVEFADGSIKAQLSQPDMRLPIQYALSHPERLPNPQLPHLDWSQIKELSFGQPDYNKFPCLKLAIEAGEKGGTYPAVLCAADEVAVELFLSGQIKFTDIARLVEKVLEKHEPVNQPTLDEIMAADDWARKMAQQLAGGGSQ